MVFQWNYLKCSTNPDMDPEPLLQDLIKDLEWAKKVCV